MSKNATNSPDGASNTALAALTDFNLDRKIVEFESNDRERAH